MLTSFLSDVGKVAVRAINQSFSKRPATVWRSNQPVFIGRCNMTHAPTSNVLQGLKVVEFGAIGPAPWCCMQLADMGATICRIENPSRTGSPDDNIYMMRGREFVTLDLKHPEGHAEALRRVGDADVVIEGFRPGVMEKLGLGPKECMDVNPGLVYGRMTGWGQSGPLALRAGHDINYIALTGALHAIGTPERPIPPLNLVGDYGGGGAFLTIGILAAVLHVRSGGEGKVVDAAMVDGSASLMTMPFATLRSGGWSDVRGTNFLDGAHPWYGVYETSDSKFIAVGAIEPKFYAALLKGLEFDSDGFPDRSASGNLDAIRKLFTERFLSRTRDEWARIFEGTDACVTPVLSMTEAPHHPHNMHRSTFIKWPDGSLVPAAAPRFI